MIVEFILKLAAYHSIGGQRANITDYSIHAIYIPSGISIKVMSKT